MTAEQIAVIARRMTPQELYEEMLLARSEYRAHIPVTGEEDVEEQLHQRYQAWSVAVSECMTPELLEILLSDRGCVVCRPEEHR